MCCLTLTSRSVYIDLPSGMALTNIPSGLALIKSGVGDFDNDGDVDFLAWDSGANKVYLVRNNGLSGLNPEETILPNAAFVIADVDTDGDLDLYKGGDYAWNPPELHTNDGNGIFARNYKSAVGNDVLKADGSATFFADLNGDGFTDVLAQGERQDADANRFWQTEIWLTQHTPVQIDKNVAASASLTAILRGMDLSPGSTPTTPHKYLLGPSADMNGDGCACAPYPLERPSPQFSLTPLSPSCPPAIKVSGLPNRVRNGRQRHDPCNDPPRRPGTYSSLFLNISLYHSPIRVTHRLFVQSPPRHVCSSTGRELSCAVGLSRVWPA